ncbi:hypothetical protein JR316_0011210 [Psilocybe cubensis]|uniref:Uncharacterized protein n=2 Tax=Psilocybe cubensis TaxID=181762 RepID=A0ACB8GIX5_PSICU|nr:hypothetical protein JR316_0011210 [Psilocybe cubensis]KAH9475653.1 hypothetical protein JR316_0011210 [Psilocybe cubensis]
MQNANVVSFSPINSEHFAIPTLSTSISWDSAWSNLNFYSEGRYTGVPLDTVQTASNIQMFPSVASSYASEEASQDTSASTHHAPLGSESLSYPGFVPQGTQELFDNHHLSEEDNVSINGQTNNTTLDVSSPELLPTNNIYPDTHVSVLVGHEGSEDTTYPTNTPNELTLASDTVSQSDPIDSLLSYVLSTGTIDPALLAKSMPSSHSKREQDIPQSQVGDTLFSRNENNRGTCSGVYKPVRSAVDDQDMRANSFRHGYGETETSKNDTFQHQEPHLEYRSRATPVEQIPTMESEPHDARREPIRLAQSRDTEESRVQCHESGHRETRPARREKRTRSRSPTEETQDRLPKRRKNLESVQENNSRGRERMNSNPGCEAPTKKKGIQGHRSDYDDTFRSRQEITSSSSIRGR